ncbi:phosphoribosylaminoimidazolecarboxamide formyltransferase/IMP cyclohydrolase [Stella humosa]|uniref:Bifunctional purine biosynthesis protein PurH n=1 Tax=Stella humosa TaxID=94 RepID=A0A3N1KQ05_9PROT|nr:bifunctional phosphoribosylaminoimidazolecarboxamide formyltransferase/IMP cyclohydrolase [Stella humosa]ROP80869.1 phosphoribosylaminoimidazolecarboxamide formyltransferase/IMP cyclohydrolase [Stella humosa]BBK33338.1 bifunctional purine biosynthesis protein PurH [Stella humosa]
MADATPVSIARAIISVSDKTGLVELGRALAAHGVEILSTGGSAKALAAAGIAVTEVSAHTGFPEIMDGRVKTLHPTVHGGILARRDEAEHLAAMERHAIRPIDLVIVNLYPFRETVARGAAWDECVENIDIGGPAMIRAAAKNHDFVAVVTAPAQYPALLEELSAHGGGTTLPLRRRLAAEAYAHTAAYDAAVAGWMAAQAGETFPATFVAAAERRQVLRYGENPHQQAAFYTTGEQRAGVATARQVQGKELSFNNFNDTDAAFELAAEFVQPAVVIVKHANPCGVATGATILDAWGRALACDPVSAFGGIVAINRPLDKALVDAFGKLFLEVIIAPDATEEAMAALARKANLRLLLTGGMPDPAAAAMNLRSVAGGYLLQTRDARAIDPAALQVVTKRQPTPQEMADLVFAFTIAKHVKSNAIVYARDGATVGIGAGQMSRVDSARMAAWKAEEAGRIAGLTESPAKGAVAASDAFFPFADGLLATAAAGATAVIQPGGSMRDAEVIAAADEAGLAMVLTGHRHFRH